MQVLLLHPFPARGIFICYLFSKVVVNALYALTIRLLGVFERKHLKKVRLCVILNNGLI